MTTCCFTGHRRLPREEYPALRERTERAIRRAYEAGCRRFFAGGALGFDMLAAAIVTLLRDSEYPDITLTLLLPCADQDSRWAAGDRRRYAAMLAAADVVHTLSTVYREGVMRERNRALVDSADLCIAYLTDRASGTGSTVSMAERRAIPVWNVAEEI
ncbi:MAG: DUF1273 family protein [Clostridia bacterium]|nr:DUF1273 family protein [Clostridia bacterium]